MPTDPIGAVVSVFGLQSPDFGASCEHHRVCGSNVDYDVLVRFKKKTIRRGKWHILTQQSTTIFEKKTQFRL